MNILQQLCSNLLCVFVDHNIKYPPLIEKKLYIVKHVIWYYLNNAVSLSQSFFVNKYSISIYQSYNKKRVPFIDNCFWQKNT